MKPSLLNKTYSQKRLEDTYQYVEISKLENPLITKILPAIVCILFLAEAVLFYISFFMNSVPEDVDYIESSYQSTPFKAQTEFHSPYILREAISSDRPDIYADAYIAMDPNTDQILYRSAGDEELQIASITKLMTVWIMLDTYDTQDLITVQGLDPNLEYVVGFVNGDKVTVADLLRIMIISSHNDSAYIVANAYPYGGYDGFLNEMNARAEALGMENTHFANPNGYDDDNNYSTVNDLVKLVQVLVTYPDVLDVADEYSAIITILRNGATVPKTIYTTNSLLGVEDNIRGLKTGTTYGAGACFVGYFDSGDNDNIITIVLDSPDRFSETEEMYRAVSDNFK